MRIIEVAAGVLQDSSGRVLLARRPEGVHQGGLWEFPGGKVETGESVHQALDRELEEELGIQIRACRPLIRVGHRYEDRHVVLDTWLVTDWQGEPRGREGQPLQWGWPWEIDPGTLPVADLPILKALGLPSRYVITPPCVEDTHSFLAQLENTLELGLELVQFRVFGLETARWRKLVREADRLCREAGARMLVNAPLQEALGLEVQGLHLNSQRLLAMDSLEEARGLVVGASCHDERELRKAQALGADFAVLSPVLATPSHPGARPLGWKGFFNLVRQSNLPVYALGGMKPEMLEQAWQHGAQGISGISGLWNSP